MRPPTVSAVLTIRAAKSPSYYEQAEFARDDYYAERGAALGQWAGRGAEALRLTGAPAAGGLAMLLEGRQVESGERLPGLRRGRRNVGFDLTWTAPKSVSVLLAVGGDEIRRAVFAAHEAGVRAGLDYLERYECHARRGAGGERIVSARGFAGALYTHEMSRAGDPHLHTHLVVANAVEGSDGRWSAPDMRPVFQAAKTAGTIAEAAMRAELTRRLGVEWGEVRNGTAELAGVPDRALAHFSRRRAETRELAEARGARTLQAVGAAQRETRDHKREIDRERAQAEWRARAAEHGFGRRELRKMLARPRRPTPKYEHIADHLAGSEGLTQRSSTFDRREALRGFAETHAQGITLERLEQTVARFLKERAILVERADPERGRRATWTTPDMLEAEQRLLAVSQRERAGVTPLVEECVRQALAARPTLGDDQREAVRRLAADRRPVRVLEAGAGRGKTFALGALREAYEAAGVRVFGVAWQGEAAQVLGREAGIESETCATLLGRIERGEELPRRALWIVDEGSTMPTRPLLRVLKRAIEAGGAVVLVGDRNQLPAIDAGGAHAALADRLGAVELTENRRQKTPLQRLVADALAAGRAADALAVLRAHGRLRAYTTPEEACRGLIAEWAEAAIDRPQDSLILAHDRADVVELNRLARARMEEAGRLGSERVVAHGREWAVGDRLICRRNDYRRELDVRNGTRGTVVSVDVAAGSITAEADDGRVLVLPADYLEHVHYGYASTGHVAQGVTTERTYVYARPERGSREWGYVAGTRHRIDLRLYTTHDDSERALEALLRGFERTQRKTFALDKIEERERAEPYVSGPASTPAASELRKAELAMLRQEQAELRALRATYATAEAARKGRKAALGRVRAQRERLGQLRFWQREARRDAQAMLARAEADAERFKAQEQRARERAEAIGQSRRDLPLGKRRHSRARTPLSRLVAEVARRERELRKQARELAVAHSDRVQWAVRDGLGERGRDGPGPALVTRDRLRDARQRTIDGPTELGLER